VYSTKSGYLTGELGLVCFYRWPFVAQGVAALVLFVNTGVFLYWHRLGRKTPGSGAMLLLIEMLVYWAAALFALGALFYGRFAVLFLELGPGLFDPQVALFEVPLAAGVAWVLAVSVGWVVHLWRIRRSRDGRG
jgi:hypothetical protein